MPTNAHNDDKRLLELLDRWQSGDFTRANERELRALADSDEFRREAMEGFLSLPEADHARHLASLRDRLKMRARGRRRIPLLPVMAAAAAVAMLAIAVVWLMPDSQKSVPTMQEEAMQPIENQPIASNLPPTPPPEQNTPLPSRPDKPAPGKQTGPAATGAGAAVSETFSTAPPPAALSTEEASDKNMMAQPQEAAGEAKTAEAAQDDEEGAAPGNAATRAAQKREASEPAKAKDAAKKRAAKPTAASQPADGWDNFQEYLRRNARLPEAARQHNVSGMVRLRFRLDENNQPLEFKVLRSLGYGCDEEAVRLVKAYAWKRGSDPEITVDVPFVR